MKAFFFQLLIEAAKAVLKAAADFGMEWLKNKAQDAKLAAA